MTNPTADASYSHGVDYGRPGTHLAALAAAIAELDTSCREQRETIDRLTGERDRARDIAVRLEAELAAIRPECLRLARERYEPIVVTEAPTHATHGDKE